MKINELISDIRNRDLVLPEFQREYVWTKEQAKQLLVSLIKKYPVGGILLWKTQTPPELKNVSESDSRLGSYQLILDGQQRLTTLYMLLTGDIPPYYREEDILYDPRDLFFNLIDGDFQYYQPVKMKDDPTWVSVIVCIQDTGQIAFDVAQKVHPEQEDLFVAAQLYTINLQNLKGILNIDLPEQVIPPEATLDQAIDVFDRVNSLGTKLTDAELALTHVTGKWPQARRVIKGKIDQLSESNFEFDLTFMTRSLTTVVTNHALYDQIHSYPRKEVEAGWKKLYRILDYLVNILSTQGFIHSTQDLSTTNALVPLIKYLDINDFRFPNERSMKNALHWLYIALMLQRYTGQTDQRLERDISIVVRESNPWNSLLDQIVDQRGRKDVSANDFEGRGSGHPLYKMSFILAKSRRAVDWFNGITLGTAVGDRYRIQSHHIFPQNILYRNGFDSHNHVHVQFVNAIANRAFITGETNLDISDRRPEEYLPEVEERYPGALQSQLIPMDRNLWKVENYRDFLAARRELISTALNEYLDSLISTETESTARPVTDIIRLGEGPNVEFKSTLQWDVREEKRNIALRHEVLKTLVAFMNSDGGTLLIGVEDSGQIFGLEKDLEFTRGSEDLFLNMLSTLIIENIGVEFVNRMQARIESVSDSRICVVNVSKSLDPVFLSGPRGSEFFVRAFNTTRQLDSEQTMHYLESNTS
tara:strand:+ start:214 stop:2319 length:2106 start_codon:yes stop_codon:yes gene_type:complete